MKTKGDTLSGAGEIETKAVESSAYIYRRLLIKHNLHRIYSLIISQSKSLGQTLGNYILCLQEMKAWMEKE